MLDEKKRKTQQHLLNLVKRRSGTTPGFALHVGAGASVSSGVKPAAEMIKEWRTQLYEHAKCEKPIEEWLKQQSWYGDDEEYALLFESLYDEPSQRRNYIEECVKEADPSWGYIYLANTIAHNYFNVVFTTNFDDLLNEACFLYADTKPVVCAHDSAVAGIRLTSTRPKIIKLHGDFLYDNIKNTVDETERLEDNMRNKLRQFCSEYGLVVVGYAGNDRSVMDILDTMLKSPDYLPGGLYWCLRDPNRASKRLQRLLARDRAYWVQIEGFDELMAELHGELKIPLPATISDPYKATTARLNAFTAQKERARHPVITRDIDAMSARVLAFQQAVSKSAALEGQLDDLVAYKFLGQNALAKREYAAAVTYFERAERQGPNDESTQARLFRALWLMERFDDALRKVEARLERQPANRTDLWHAYKTLAFLGRQEDALKVAERLGNSTTIVNTLLSMERWEDALSASDSSFKAPLGDASTVNRANALLHLNRKEEAAALLGELRAKLKGQPYIRACLEAVQGDKVQMLKFLGDAIGQDPMSRLDARRDPDFMEFRDDADFQKLVGLPQVPEPSQ